MITSHIPLGSEISPTVPFLNVWTQGWNAHALRGGLQGYWDAPIFYPVSGAFALSDPQVLTSVISLAIWDHAPALSYNLVLLTYIALNGISAYGLLRHMNFKPSLALAGGLIVQSLPFLTNERGVLQLIPLFGPLMMLHIALELRDRPGPRQGLMLAAAMILTITSSEYLALGSVIPLAVLAFLNLKGRDRQRKALFASLAIGLVLIVAIPLRSAQGSRLERLDFSRSVTTFSETSAKPMDFLQLSNRVRSSTLWPETSRGSGQLLSPGISLSLIARPGFLLGLRSPNRRRWVLFLGLMTFIMFTISLGSNFKIGGWSPLEWIFQNFQVLRWTRSPFRFALFVQLGLALLSLEAIRWIHQRQRFLLLPILAIILIELLPIPESLVRLPARASWQTALPAERPQVIVHLPWADGKTVSYFKETTEWMIGSLQVGAQIANGYSGFFPSIERQMRFLMPLFPRGNTYRVMESLGIDMVIYHGRFEADIEDEINNLIDGGELTELAHDSDGWVLALPPTSLRSVEEYTGQWSLRSSIVAGRLQVRIHAEVPDDQVYVYASGVTPVSWELILDGSAREKGMAAIPLGSGLIYHGSDTWLVISTDWGPPDGEAVIELRDATRGNLLGRHTFNVVDE